MRDIRSLIFSMEIFCKAICRQFDIIALDRKDIHKNGQGIDNSNGTQLQRHVDDVTEALSIPGIKSADFQSKSQDVDLSSSEQWLADFILREEDMASIIANLPSPPLLVHGKKTLFSTLQMLPLSPIKERQSRVAVVVKATGESSESSTSLSIVKSVQNIWEDSEDRLALVGLGFAALVAIWASANLLMAIDKLPVVPSALELIGILFSAVSNLPQLMVFTNVRANEKEL
ncbi:unnamed protein product [Dovyalis caffra]|uniref:Cyanobacterial aminoacyl-tRNA synthetase CAAD domain-containing protein n=1 Tax=Dovyalis caffra TaxID=77055 RepID=A0AAV1SV71_9ROSI|nr:unnamed protein product [Dovyalis caffra]